MSSKPTIHARRASFSASKALDRIAEDLSAIKKEDGLTWGDIGRVLGKGEDQASKYGSGLAEMSVTSFLLASREWNGRFANGVLSLIGMKLVEVGGDLSSDSEKLSRILKLAHLISAALTDIETPGTVDDDELAQIGAEALDEATRAIDALRARMSTARLSLVGGAA